MFFLLIGTESGAAEGAEPVLRIHRSRARSARHHLGQRRDGPGIDWGEGVGGDEAAVEGGALVGPAPNGDEEELQDLLRIHEVGWSAAAYAATGGGLDDAAGLLLDAAGEERD